MAKKSSGPKKATTAPKGTPTRRRNEMRAGSRISPALQWFLLTLAVVVAAVGLWLLFDGGSFGDDDDAPPPGFDGVGGALVTGP